MSVIYAYFDMNTVEDVAFERAGVDAAMVRALKAAIAQRRLAVPFSDLIALEIAPLARKNGRRAASLGARYFNLADTDLCMHSPRETLLRAFERLLTGSTSPPFFALRPKQRDAVQRGLRGQIPEATDPMNEQTHAEIQQWLDNVRDSAAAARASGVGQGAAPRSLAEWVQSMWGDGSLAAHWADGTAERTGFKRRVRAAGLTAGDLLKVPEIAVAMGFMVALAVSQTMNGRKPDYGDFRDGQHAFVATGSGAVLITQDVRLRDTLEAIPGAPLRVLTLPQLLAIC